MTIFRHLPFSFVLLASSAVSPSVSAAEGPARIEEIIVTASPVARTRLETAQAATVLSGDRLFDALNSSLGEMLESQPGISSTFFGPIASRPIIRGFDGDRVRILSGGLGIVDVSSLSPDHQVAQDMLAVRRIEVLRGPATLLYGTGAIGGVVNIDDGRVPVVRPEGGIDGLLKAEYSTNNRAGQVGGYTDFALGSKVVVHADGSARDGKNYRAKGFSGPDAELAGIEGRVPNSGGDSQHYATGASVLFESGYVGLAYSRLSSDYGSPAEPGLFAEEPGEDPAAVRLGVDQSRYELRSEARNLNGFFQHFALKGAISDYSHTEFEGDETGTVFESNGSEVRAEGTHRSFAGLSGVLGLQWREREFSAIGAEAFVPPTQTKQYAPFIVEDYEIGALILQAGARIERTSVTNIDANVRRKFTSAAASLSATYETTPGVFLSATASWSERPPTAEELFSNGPHLATNQFEIGNPVLDEEEARHVDVSLKMKRGPVTLAAHVFRSTHRDFIFADETGAFEDGLPIFQFTAVDARFYGAELEADWTVLNDGGWVGRLDGAVDLVRARDTTADRPLPRIPPVQYRVGFDVEHGITSARLELAGAARQNRIARNETSTRSYQFLNAQIAFAPWRDQGVRFLIQGRNLTDSQARAHTSFIKDVAPLLGRDVRLSVQARF